MLDWALAACLAVAATLVVTGVWAMHRPAGLITAGVLLAGWSLLVFGEVDS